MLGFNIGISLRTNHNHCPLTGKNTSDFYSGCINGVLYYRATIGFDQVIMSFEVRSKKLDVITSPWGKSRRLMMISSYHGKLACVGYSKSGNSISMWVLEDAAKHKWSNHLYSPLSHYGKDLQHEFKLSGITDDGELIYVPRMLLLPLYIIYILIQRDRRSEESNIERFWRVILEKATELETNLCVTSIFSPITLKLSHDFLSRS